MNEHIMMTESGGVIADESGLDMVIFSPDSDSVTEDFNSVASAIGDPHVVTFDGVKYTL
jgi:hypothetical protein